MADSDVSKSGEKEDNAEENQSEHSSIKTIIVSHALAAVAKVVGEDELAKQCLEGGSSTEQPEEAPTDDEVKDKHDTQVVEKEEEEEEVKSDVRSTVVHAAGAVGGLLGGSIGAAAAGAIVGVVCDVTTAIVTGGEEMTGICEIIKDPTNKEAWVDGVSSVVSDGLAGVAGGHQTETPAQTESATFDKDGWRRLVTGVLVHEGCSKGLLSQRIRTKEAAADRSTHVELSMTGETVVMAQWGGASSGILHLLIFRMKNEIAEELIRWFSSAVSRHSRYHIADDPSL